MIFYTKLKEGIKLKVRDLINKIVDSEDKSKMYEMQDVFEDLLCNLKEHHSKIYHKYKMCLYKIAYGENLNEEMAKDIVADMQPYGEHWSMQQTSDVLKSHNLNVNDIDFYVVMNRAYNDYHELFEENIEYYVKYSKLFIEDEDAKKGKVFLYFTTIPKED